MKLVFASSFQYPAFPAQFKHGLLMAREYAKLLPQDFLYLILQTKSPNELVSVPYREINPLHLPLRRFRLISLYYFFYFGWFFMSERSWRGPDLVVITQESKIAFSALLWKKLFAFSVVYECHGLHAPSTDRFVCQKADALIFVNQATEEAARREFGPLPKTRVLPNAVDLSLFETQKSKTELRKELDLPNDRYLVGYVGRFVALGSDKGIETALRAVPSITDRNISLVFVGATPEELTSYGALAKSLGVADRSILIPYQRDEKKLAAYLLAMDALMYIPPPTKFFKEETSPMKLYEYMAAGKPIVVSDFPALHEVLTENAAYFIAPEPHAFGEVIETLPAHAEERMEKARNARALVQERSWGKRAKSLLSFVKSE